MLTLAVATTVAIAVLIGTGPGPAPSRLARLGPLGATRRSTRHTALATHLVGQAGETDENSRAHNGGLASPRARAAAAALAAAGTAAIVGGTTGVIMALAAGAGTWVVLGRLEPGAETHRRERYAAALPATIDLLVAALAAGCPTVDAVIHVGRAIDGPLGSTLVRAATAAQLTVEPTRAWSELVDDPVLHPLGRALTSATVRGTSPATALQRAADDARSGARWAAQSHARAVGARAAAPLGLCFLPAFVLLGIVPVIATSGLSLP
ncbi:type II secretion system F family protein [Phytoactinopolyspora limicola]|uniref:type II secretion system F family protein n=1 Tax=Phytoactinopolyspora limicola TaxID=2715536 RepID=UPI001409F41F|nr:type II secretion system F family protein [Phytoactinopolyspora limicola]